MCYNNTDKRRPPLLLPFTSTENKLISDLRRWDAHFLTAW